MRSSLHNRLTCVSLLPCAVIRWAFNLRSDLCRSRVRHHHNMSSNVSVWDCSASAQRHTWCFVLDGSDWWCRRWADCEPSRSLRNAWFVALCVELSVVVFGDLHTALPTFPGESEVPLSGGEWSFRSDARVEKALRKPRHGAGRVRCDGAASPENWRETRNFIRFDRSKAASSACLGLLDARRTTTFRN